MITRVMRYRVEKYIKKNGILSSGRMAEDLNISLENITKILEILYPESDEITSVNRNPTLDEMITYIKSKGGDPIGWLLEFEYWPAACACMGPAKGSNMPCCGCVMHRNIFENKRALINEFYNMETWYEHG
jgi:hypothetical protein